jgi:hypothetical protein
MKRSVKIANQVLSEKLPTAYCYASGEIVIRAGKLPSGALPIKFDCTKADIQKIKARARLAYNNKTFLVPGIPEAADQHEAYAALQKFIDFAVHDKIPARA